MPVVAYYPEVIAANVGDAAKITLIHDYLGLHRKRDFPVKAHAMLNQYFDGISLKEVKKRRKPPMRSITGILKRSGPEARRFWKPLKSREKRSSFWPAGPTMWTRRSTTVLIS